MTTKKQQKLTWVVGKVATSENTGRRLGRFMTEAEAAAFISTLPDHESGKYYLDNLSETL